MAVISRLLGRKKSDDQQKEPDGDQRTRAARRVESQKEEPDYVVTSKFDGSKSVDLDKFIEDEEIARQIRDLAGKSER
jgi:hypothetical protein